MEKLYTVNKTRPGADCGSDHVLLIAKFRLIEESRPLDHSCMTSIKSLLVVQWQ